METVLKAIADWIKGILTAGIMSNLSGLFDDVNTQVGNIAQQVGTKPSSFEPRVFAMIEALSRNVVLPIAGIILTFIACYELIEMITQHNNMAQFEPALIMRWIFKTAVSVWFISNTFDIVMAVFDITQKVVSDSSGIIAGNTRVNDIGLSMLEASLMQMDGFILDGHTRYRILRKHPFIAFQIQEIELDNRYAALSWICQNQLGRRNLDPERKKFLMGKLYESEKLARGGSKERAHDENGRFTSIVQNDPLRAKPLSTCERIAAQNGVGAATVKRAEKYAKGVDAAEDAVPGAREEILTGRIKATDAEITALAKTPKAEIPAALAELRKPKQERQPPKAETASSKQTLSEISKSIHGHQRQLTAEEKTSLKASIDNRYQERAVANGSLMMCEVQGAKEDFIRRWNTIFKEYPDVFEDSDCRKIIHDLTEDAVQYLLKIKEKTI